MTLKTPNWFEPKITVGNLIQLAVIMGGGVWVYFTLITDVAGSKKAAGEATAAIAVNSADIRSLQNADAVFNTRISIVESRAETAATEMDRLAAGVQALSNDLQQVKIDTAVTKRDAAFTRDWIEKQITPPR